MHKMVKAYAAMLFVLALLVACAPNKVESEVAENDAPPSMFVEVEQAHTWSVVYHRNTKVMYAVSRGGYNNGTFTLLVSADGTPMIYNG